MSGIVQYVVVRSDLLGALKWPVGAVVAQACHATAAVTHLYADDACTQQYFSDIDNMHKVHFILLVYTHYFVRAHSSGLVQKV